jgi:glutathione S-transferase
MKNMSPHLELWQTEWCPASHRVRQRLTELGLTYAAHQVPVQRDDRTRLDQATGRRTIPILVAGSDVIEGEQAILTYLVEHFSEPPDAEQHRAKAAKAKQKELEEACPKLAALTH